MKPILHPFLIFCNIFVTYLLHIFLFFIVIKRKKRTN
nr:MAG TPA: hypothetical protein [Bacteriophage sp.]